jgi:hypothetical protein
MAFRVRTRVLAHLKPLAREKMFTMFFVRGSSSIPSRWKIFHQILQLKHYSPRNRGMFNRGPSWRRRLENSTHLWLGHKPISNDTRNQSHLPQRSNWYGISKIRHLIGVQGQKQYMPKERGMMNNRLELHIYIHTYIHTHVYKYSCSARFRWHFLLPHC